MSTTYAEKLWESVARDGYRYANGFMTRDHISMPVPVGERRAAKVASIKEAETLPRKETADETK